MSGSELSALYAFFPILPTVLQSGGDSCHFAKGKLEDHKVCFLRALYLVINLFIHSVVG